MYCLILLEIRNSKSRSCQGPDLCIPQRDGFVTASKSQVPGIPQVSLSLCMSAHSTLPSCVSIFFLFINSHVGSESTLMTSPEHCIRSDPISSKVHSLRFWRLRFARRRGNSTCALSYITLHKLFQKRGGTLSDHFESSIIVNTKTKPCRI